MFHLSHFHRLVRFCWFGLVVVGVCLCFFAFLLTTDQPVRSSYQPMTIIADFHDCHCRYDERSIVQKKKCGFPPPHSVGCSEGWPLRQLSRLCRWWTAQWSISSLPSFNSSVSPRVYRSPTASLGPRNTFLRCGFLCWSIFSFVLLSQYFPSRVSPFQYEMVGTVAVDGAPRFLSVFRSRGVSWTLYFRSLTVPLLGSVPSCCRCFTPICAA